MSFIFVIARTFSSCVCEYKSMDMQLKITVLRKKIDFVKTWTFDIAKREKSYDY